MQQLKAEGEVIAYPEEGVRVRVPCRFMHVLPFIGQGRGG